MANQPTRNSFERIVIPLACVWLAVFSAVEIKVGDLAGISLEIQKELKQELGSISQTKTALGIIRHNMDGLTKDLSQLDQDLRNLHIKIDTLNACII